MLPYRFTSKESLDDAALTARPLQPLSKHQGRAVLLFFWAHWCADCKAEAGIVAQLKKMAKAEKIKSVWCSGKNSSRLCVP